MENTFFAINSCFSTEIYDEKYLYQKLENIYSFADNYLDISSKIYLINDGPISIPINHNKIKVISSKKRLGRDVEPVNKVVTCFNYFIESDCDTIIWLLDDFYTFPSFIQKLKESKHDIILSRFNLNPNLFENFLFIKNNKFLVLNLIDFLKKYNERFDESFIVNFLYEMKLSESEKINFDLIKSFRPHKNFKMLSEEELENYSQYDLLYQSTGFDAGVYGKDIFFKNTI